MLLFLSNDFMATGDVPEVPIGAALPQPNAALQRHWRMQARLSSFVAHANSYLDRSRLDRGPWLVVAFGSGIALWFMLAGPWQWVAAVGVGLLAVLTALSLWSGRPDREALLPSVSGFALAFSVGLVVIWLRSATVGVVPVEYPRVERFEARILEREEQPAQARVRLTVAMRDADSGIARKIRLNVPTTKASEAFSEGQ